MRRRPLPIPPSPSSLRWGRMVLLMWFLITIVWIALPWFYSNAPRSKIVDSILFAMLIAGILLWIRGTYLRCRRLIQHMGGSTCFRCGYELDGTLDVQRSTCPECGTPAPAFQRDRVEYGALDKAQGDA